MPSTIVVPSLTDWITDPQRQLNTMFANALLSDYSQSDIYLGNVTSLPYLVAQHQHNPTTMANVMEDALHAYYIRVFPIVSVSVTFSDSVDNKYQLFISITITVGSANYSLATSALIENGKLVTLVKELNL